MTGQTQIDEQGNIQYKIDTPDAVSPTIPGHAKENLVTTYQTPTAGTNIKPTPKIERLMQVKRIDKAKRPESTTTETPIQTSHASSTPANIHNNIPENANTDSLANLEQRVFSNQFGTENNEPTPSKTQSKDAKTVTNQNMKHSLPTQRSKTVDDPFISNQNTLDPLPVFDRDSLSIIPMEVSQSNHLPATLPVKPTDQPTPSEELPKVDVIHFGSNSLSSRLPGHIQNIVDHPPSSVSGAEERHEIPNSIGGQPTITRSHGEQLSIMSQEGSMVGVNGQPIKTIISGVNVDGKEQRIAQNLITGPNGQILSKVEKTGSDGKTHVSFKPQSKIRLSATDSSNKRVNFDETGKPLLRVEKKKITPVGPVESMVGPNGEMIDVSRHKQVSSDGSLYEEKQQQRIVSADGSHVSEALKTKKITPELTGVKDTKRQRIASHNRLHIKETENQKTLKPELLEIKKSNREETHRPDVAHFKEEKNEMTVDVSGTSHFKKSQHQELIGPNRSAFSSSFSSKTVFAPTMNNPMSVPKDQEIMKEGGNKNDFGINTHNVQNNNLLNTNHAVAEGPPSGFQQTFSEQTPNVPHFAPPNLHERVRTPQGDVFVSNPQVQSDNFWNNPTSDVNPQEQITVIPSHDRIETSSFDVPQATNRQDMIVSSNNNVNPHRGPGNSNMQNMFRRPDHMEMQNQAGPQWRTPHQPHVTHHEPSRQGFVNNQEQIIETQHVLGVPNFFGSSPWGHHIAPNEVHGMMQTPHFIMPTRVKRQAGLRPPPPPPHFDNMDFSGAQTNTEFIKGSETEATQHSNTQPYHNTATHGSMDAPIPLPMNMDPTGDQTSGVRSAGFSPGGEQTGSISTNQHIQPMFESGNFMTPPPPSFVVPSSEDNKLPIPPTVNGFHQANGMHTQMTSGTGKHSSSMKHTQSGMEEIAFHSGDVLHFLLLGRRRRGSQVGLMQSVISLLDRENENG